MWNRSEYNAENSNTVVVVIQCARAEHIVNTISSYLCLS